MRYPILNALPRENRVVTGFGGYEHSGKAAENTFYDMSDLSSDGFPLLSTRARRGRWSVSGGGEYFPDGKITFTDDEIQSCAEVGGRTVFCTKYGVYVNGERYPGIETEDISPRIHRIVPFGRSFMIYPDGIFFEADGGSYTVKHARYRFVNSNTLVKTCSSLGTELVFDDYGDVLPDEAEEGTKFLKTGEERSYLYTFSDGAWGNETEIWLKLSASNIGRYAYEGEPIVINGLCGRDVKAEIGAFTSGTLRVFARGRPDESLLESGGSMVVTSLVISRRMPELDHICEHGNRLWGCRYGDDGSGGFVNEIYASALGDPTVWDEFEGISTDSYRVSLGCSGEFTGICSLEGDVICFKEGHIVRVSGSEPSDYYVTVTPARGIKRGESDSLAVLNEKAFYRSDSGMTVFDGSMPYVISESLGGLEYVCTSAGKHRGKYYAAITEKGGKRAVLVYDTTKGMWHRESDRENIVTFAYSGGRLFAVCRRETENGGEYSFWCVAPDEDAAFDIFSDTPRPGAEYTYIGEEPLEWYAVTGDICAKIPGTRIVRGIGFRITAEKNARLDIAVCCNNDSDFKRICSLDRPVDGYFRFCVNTPRCDCFRLRIGGTGGCTVHEMNVITEKTSEVSRHG